MSVTIGIDVATSAVRAVALDVDSGCVLGFTGAPLPEPRRDGAGGSTQQPGYAAAALAALAGTAAALGARAREVSALSVTATSGTVVAADGTGTPVADALMYDDRGDPDAADLLREAGFGAPTLPRMTRQAAAPAVRWLLGPADVVVAALTGAVRATDTSHALKAGVDQAQLRWPDDWLARVGVDSGLLPDLVHPGTALAEMTPPVARQLGLPAGVVVVAGMTDGCTAQISSGAVTVGDTVSTLGTTLVFKGVAAQSIATDDGSVYSHLAPDGNYWPGAASNAGARVIAERIPIAELAAADRAAAAGGPSSLLMYPISVAGERFPVNDPAMQPWTIGVARDRADLHRAMMEGVAFTERLGWERLSSLGLTSAGSQRIVGGGTKSAVWNRIRATVLGRELLIPPAGGSGAGAAMLAATVRSAAGLSELVARWASGVGQPPDVVRPDARERDQLDNSYHRWLDVVRKRSAAAENSRADHGLPVPGNR